MYPHRGIHLKFMSSCEKWRVIMLSAKRLGLAGGFTWGLMMFLTTLLSISFGYGTAFLTSIASLYPGYDISYFGSLIALLYGFLDGFIGLYLIGWFYNNLGA